MLKIERLSPVIGAEVSGANLISPNDDEFKELEQALAEYSVLFFRDQPILSPKQQVAFATQFGTYPLECLGPDGVQDPPHGCGARETDHVNVWVLGEQLADLGPRAHDHVEDAGGKTCSVDRLWHVLFKAFDETHV